MESSSKIKTRSLDELRHTNASLFAVQEACEPVHIVLNEKTGHPMVINNRTEALTDAKANVAIYDLDGKIASESDVKVTAASSAVTDLGLLALPDNLSPVYFVKLQLHDADGQLLSDNFYWYAAATHPDNMHALNQLPTVTLDAKVTRYDTGGKCLLNVTLYNPTSHIAVMAHLQLCRQNSGARVLPVYYTDNYVSLTPGKSKTVTIEAAQSDLNGQKPFIDVDGWNVAVKPWSSSSHAAVALNEDAQVDHWPKTGLPIVPYTYVDALQPAASFKISCVGDDTCGVCNFRSLNASGRLHGDFFCTVMFSLPEAKGTRQKKSKNILKVKNYNKKE